jgi:hypothetical protein
LPRLRSDLCVALLLGISVFALLGCGGGDGETATKATTVAKGGKQRGRRGPTAAKRCRLGPFLHALDILEERLAAGLSYEQYVAEVRAAKTAYEAIAVDELELPCLTAVGTPGEKALNQYIEAANAWRECRADVSCGTYTIEPRLQRKWRVASHYIAEAHAART